MGTGGIMKRCLVTVRGRVQGVGFRYFACRKAAMFDVSGWVRNIKGGDVELECEGRAEDLDSFLAYIRKGPLYSHVVDMDIEERPYTGKYSGFVAKNSIW